MEKSSAIKYDREQHEKLHEDEVAKLKKELENPEKIKLTEEEKKEFEGL